MAAPLHPSPVRPAPARTITGRRTLSPKATPPADATLTRAAPAPAPARPAGRPARAPSVEGPLHQLELALADLNGVFGVYPFRASMPVCNHCVSPSDLRALSRHPASIPGPILDRYLAKSLITWGEAVDLKRLLPEIMTRLCRGDLASPDALVGARLRRAGWLTWPAAETPAVRRTLRAGWLTTLATAPGPGRAPITHRLALITCAEDELSPYLDLWEDRLDAPANPQARLAAVLHLSDLLAPLADGGRRRLARSFPLARRSVVGQLDHWLRQPLVVQRLARAADALDGTPHGASVARAREGLAQLRTAG